jgi:hypothetical protein
VTAMNEWVQHIRCTGPVQLSFVEDNFFVRALRTLLIALLAQALYRAIIQIPGQPFTSRFYRDAPFIHPFPLRFLIWLSRLPTLGCILRQLQQVRQPRFNKRHPLSTQHSFCKSMTRLSIHRSYRNDHLLHTVFGIFKAEETTPYKGHHLVCTQIFWQVGHKKCEKIQQ